MLAERTRTAVTIRSFTPADYPKMAHIGNTCYPEFADTPEALERYDSVREPYIKRDHFIAEVGSEAVAMGSYSQRESMYHPHKFNIDITVLPEWQRQGIGTQLYQHLLRELSAFDPILLRGHGQEGRMGGPEFLRKQGFVEAMRDWESRLQLATFDPADYVDACKRVSEQGIVIQSLAELATDLRRNEKLFEMDWLVSLDMPTTDIQTKPTFEFFVKRTLENPDFLPEGWFIALDGDDYVGESALWKSQLSQDLFVGATGVLPAYRRRGIATALKVHANTFAKEYGATELKTWNAQSNRAMLSINEAMGFVKQPAWISFEKRLRDEE
jgi:GNAT superfamily N-acetyltransferase